MREQKIFIATLLPYAVLISLAFTIMFVKNQQTDQDIKKINQDIITLKQQMIQQQVMFCESYSRYGLFDSTEECLRVEYTAQTLGL